MLAVYIDIFTNKDKLSKKCRGFNCASSYIAILKIEMLSIVNKATGIIKRLMLLYMGVRVGSAS